MLGTLWFWYAYRYKVCYLEIICDMKAVGLIGSVSVMVQLGIICLGHVYNYACIIRVHVTYNYACIIRVHVTRGHARAHTHLNTSKIMNCDTTTRHFHL